MYMYGALVRVYVHYVQNIFDIKILNFLQVFQTTFISHFGQNLWPNYAETATKSKFTYMYIIKTQSKLKHL